MNKFGGIPTDTLNSRATDLCYTACMVDVPLLPENEDDPLRVFEAWLATAEASGIALPEAMTLATVSETGRPAARMVLFKGVRDNSLRFFTNYGSRKARELDRLPYAALVFHWASLCLQIRIEGKVERLPREESEAYFQSRPRPSQLGAWASPQSQHVASRQVLEDAYARTEQKFAEKPVPCPPNWGGYALHPDRFEFWLGQDRRLHDRWVYELENGLWRRARLAP